MSRPKNLAFQSVFLVKSLKKRKSRNLSIGGPLALEPCYICCPNSKCSVAGYQKICHYSCSILKQGPPYPKEGPYFSTVHKQTHLYQLPPSPSLTTRLYSHLCSIYNQKYCHFIVVCNMFDQHPTIINNRCMDYTTSARETKTILLFFLIFIVPLCN